MSSDRAASSKRYPRGGSMGVPAHRGQTVTGHANPRRALRADLLDFTGDPGLGAPSLAGVRHRPDHWLLIETRSHRRRVARGAGAGLRLACEDHRGRLLTPGLIDTHVHSVQLDVIASYGTELLDWLERYTFPAETRHADAAHAQAQADAFTDALLAHGTTAAVVFPSVHATSVRCAVRRGAAARHALGHRQGADGPPRARRPARRRDAGAERDCETLIARWHGTRPPGLCGDAALRRHQHARAARDGRRAAAAPRRRVHADPRGREPRRGGAGSPSCSPRRAATSTSTTAPACSTSVPCSRTASGSTTTTARLLADSGAQIAHSPSSNLFLGSGLFDWQAMADAKARGVAGQRRRRRHQPVDAAHAWPMPTRCRRCAACA